MARCQVCRVNLPTYDPPRGGSDLDTICNEMVNPRGGKPAAPADNFEAHQGRQGWRPRAALLRRIHQNMRGSQPGWGTTPLIAVRRQLERAAKVYYS